MEVSVELFFLSTLIFVLSWILGGVGVLRCFFLDFISIWRDLGILVLKSEVLERWRGCCRVGVCL